MSRLRELSEIKKRWNDRPAGPHLLCNACDLVIDTCCPSHGTEFAGPCWGFAFGLGTGRPPCLACVEGLEYALAYARRFQSPKVQGTGGPK